MSRDVDKILAQVAAAATSICACGWRAPIRCGLSMTVPAGSEEPLKESIAFMVTCPKCGALHRLRFVDVDVERL